MAWELSFVKSKVARRIVVSFVLAALIPITILGLLSFRQVIETLREQSTKALVKSCKDYGYGLIERLTLLENTLHFAANKIDKTDRTSVRGLLEREPWLNNHFSDLVIINLDHNGQLSLGNIVLTKAEADSIYAGKTLVKLETEPEQSGKRLWLAISLVEHHPEAGILVAEAKPEPFWNLESVEPNLLWISDESGQSWYQPEQDLDLPADVKTRFQQTNSDRFSWQMNDEGYIGAYWKLPLNTLFSGPDLIIAQGQPETLAFAAASQFNAVYPPVIMLAVLVVAYLSSKLTAKYLTPLEQLQAATVKIADGDFSCQVEIDSRDEFEALADSFNIMTHRLGNQFDILETMAELDRNILSALDADRIVETALTRLPGILSCDSMTIAKFDPETSAVSDIRMRRSGQAITNLPGPVKLSQEDAASLLGIQSGDALEIDNGDCTLSACRQMLNATGSWRYLLIPVRLEGSIVSIICLGNRAPKRIAPESRLAAINFADRIAVALSNAAWEEKLYHHAHFDALTGLPNRMVLNDRLAQELERSKRDGSQLAVFFIDLDRFKTVNDSLGHSAGDEVLTQVAKIFTGCVRTIDLVVRLGGDEFVIVVTDLHLKQDPTAYVSVIAEKVLNSLKQTLTVSGHEMTFSASLGIALFPYDGDDAQELLKNADAAMYHAKNEGRAGFRFYSRELNATALENIKLEQDLRGAIARNELAVYYQPKVDLAGRIVGAEALIRWRHSELGMISPAKFIPLAEQSGLIIEIGEWVLEQTCLLVNECRTRGLRPLRISVNLSAIDFKRPGLVEKIAEILDKTGVDPSSIELELTESVTVGDIKACIDIMNRLKALGLTLSMDDFGTGFSSLSYIKDLPIDVLKLDQSFIHGLDAENSSRAIVRAILALADGSGLEAVAEGIENQSQLEFLKQHQCGIFQGYLFSRPIPSDDFLQLLIDSEKNRPAVQADVGSR